MANLTKAMKCRQIRCEYSPSFKAIWIVAAQKFPGIRLTYTGTAEDGDNYLQEWGNRVPFIVTDAELKAALVATA